MDVNDIQRLLRNGQYELSLHAQQERLAEDLDTREIAEAISHGEILEEYPTDPRGESCLMCGHAGAKAIHAVIGWARRRGRGDKILRVITVYVPRPPKWEDPRTRGEKR